MHWNEVYACLTGRLCITFAANDVTCAECIFDSCLYLHWHLNAAFIMQMLHTAGCCIICDCPPSSVFVPCSLAFCHQRGCTTLPKSVYKPEQKPRQGGASIASTACASVHPQLSYVFTPHRHMFADCMRYLLSCGRCPSTFYPVAVHLP